MNAETVAVVVVTYNRAALLTRMLAGLAALDRAPDAVIVVDNASTDHTATVLEAVEDLPLQVIRPEENLGGSGGFHLGVQAAFEQGFDRIWLMDDDDGNGLGAHRRYLRWPVKSPRSPAYAARALIGSRRGSRRVSV